MGLLTRLFHKDTLQDVQVGGSYRFMFGSTTSGKTVTERSAMQLTAVYCRVRILSEAIAGLPLHLYRRTGEGGKEKAYSHLLEHGHALRNGGRARAFPHIAPAEQRGKTARRASPKPDTATSRCRRRSIASSKAALRW